MLTSYRALFSLTSCRELSHDSCPNVAIMTLTNLDFGTYSTLGLFPAIEACRYFPFTEDVVRFTRCIIHGLVIFFTQSHPAKILSLTMVFFAFICFAVASLSFSMGFSFGDITTLITAVGLASKATQTDIKNLTTPAALCFPYLCGLNIFDNSSSGIAHNRKK